MFGQKAAAHIHFFRSVSAPTDICRYCIEYAQIFGRIRSPSAKSQIRNNHFPVGCRLIDKFQLVPDIQEREKLFVISLDFSCLALVQSKYIAIHGGIIFQKIPKPGNSLHKKMSPMVNQIPAINNFFIPVFRGFKGIARFDTALHRRNPNAVPILIHNTSAANPTELIRFPHR